MISLQIVLLLWINLRTAPTVDEWGHLPAGLSHLETGTFHQYRVNPPLIRTLAAIPVKLHGFYYRSWVLDDTPCYRAEFIQAEQFLRDNHATSIRLFWLSRLTMIPWCVAGTLLISLIAQRLYNDAAGIAAAILWVFSPMVLTFGATIVPDVPAAVTGMVLAITYANWLQRPTKLNLLAAGMSVGLCVAVKFTWIILILLLPLIWMCDSGRKRFGPTLSALGHLCVMGVITVMFVNLTYGFVRTPVHRSQLEFCSQTFIDLQAALRFLPDFPIPLPADLILGLDTQKHDFERGIPSYLFGTWSERGWWYYYLVGGLVKAPLGLVLLLAVACWDAARQHWSWPHPLALTLYVLSVGVFVLVSSQTGFSLHLRYALPVLPAVFVFAAGAVGRGGRWRWALIRSRDFDSVRPKPATKWASVKSNRTNAKSPKSAYISELG